MMVPNDYMAQYNAAVKAEADKHTLRAWAECAVLVVAIFGVTGWMGARDEAAKQAEAVKEARQIKLAQNLTCLKTEGNVIHQWPCKLIADKYVRLD